MVKCKYCDNKFNRDAEPYYEVGYQRYVHQKCYDDAKAKNSNLKDLKLIKPGDKVNCRYCSQSFYLSGDEEYVQLPGIKRYAHKACADKPHNDKEILEDYICEKHNLSMITPNLIKQINQFIEKYNYTYREILGTLTYFYDIKNNDPYKNRDTLGIVPYMYKEAKAYWLSISNSKEINSNKKIEAYIPKKIEIIISPPKRNIKEKTQFSFLEDELNAE